MASFVCCDSDNFKSVDGRLSFHSYDSEASLVQAHPAAKRVKEIILPDYGRGSTPLTLYEAHPIPLSIRERWERGEVILDSLVINVMLNQQDFSLLAPGVRVFPILAATSPPFKHTNLVIFYRGDSVVVVDPGGNDSATLRHVLQTHVLNNNNNNNNNNNKVGHVYIFITHRHLDHWNSLSEAVSVCGDVVEVTLCGSHECLVHVQQQDKKIPCLELPMKGESELCGLKVIPTPGHTDGDLSLLDEVSGVLACGDHCVGYGSSLLDGSCGDMRLYLDTCRMLMSIKSVRILVPAHGPINYDPANLMGTYITHRLEREKQVLACMEQGLTTPQQIVAVVYKDTPKQLWPAAMSNIALHLKKIQYERNDASL